MTSLMKTSLYVAAGALILVLGYISVVQIERAGKVRLTLAVAPAAAKILADNKSTGGTTLYLSKGQHTITATLPGFQAESKTVTLSGSTSLSLAIYPNGSEGDAYMSKHPEAQQQLETFAGEDASSASNAIANYQPLINQLPYDGIVFRVDYGNPVNSKLSSSNRIALYVQSVDADSRSQALQWIRSQGVDPSTIEIVFTGLSNPFQPGPMGD
jgi:hypothetical protein